MVTVVAGLIDHTPYTLTLADDFTQFHIDQIDFNFVFLFSFFNDCLNLWLSTIGLRLVQLLNFALNIAFAKHQLLSKVKRYLCHYFDINIVFFCLGNQALKHEQSVSFIEIEIWSVHSLLNKVCIVFGHRDQYTQLSTQLCYIFGQSINFLFFVNYFDIILLKSARFIFILHLLDKFG